jgi:hypothetical protein
MTRIGQRRGTLFIGSGESHSALQILRGLQLDIDANGVGESCKCNQAL